MTWRSASMIRMTAGRSHDSRLHAGASLQEQWNGVELDLVERMRLPAELDRDIVQPARGEAGPEVAQAGDDHLGREQAEIGPGLIDGQRLEAGPCSEADHMLDGCAELVDRAARRPDRPL